MARPIKHAFVSGKSDGGDATLVRPVTGWNADHVGNGLGWYDVKEFGAYGDNSHDDTANIQDAIAQAGVGGRVNFPAGTYKIVSSLRILDGQKWRGAGSGPMYPSSGYTKLNWWGSSNDSMIEAYNRASADTFNVDIEGFFLSMGSASPGAVGIDLYRVSYSRIAACHITNTAGGIGILLDANTSNQSYYNLIERVRTAIGGSGNGGVGIKFVRGANGNICLDCESQGEDIGVYLQTASTHNVFIQHYAENDYATCFKVDAPYNKFIGCVTETTPVGFELTANATGTLRLGITGQAAAGVTTPIYYSGSLPSPGNLDIAIGTPTIGAGSGSPEGVVTALIGSLYLRTDGGASTTLYVKTSGTGNTGWTAK